MDGDYGMDAFFKTVDAVLLGRKTYAIALAQHPPKPKRKKAKAKSAPAVRSYVFSRTLSALPDEDATLIAAEAGAAVQALKAQPGKDIWLMGGGELAGSLLSAGVVDEVHLAVHPVLLGAGVPLWGALGRQVDLTLVESRPHANGVVQLKYSVQPGGPRAATP
jgi:dihydrofolate reductase